MSAIAHIGKPRSDEYRASTNDRLHHVRGDVPFERGMGRERERDRERERKRESETERPNEIRELKTAAVIYNTRCWGAAATVSSQVVCLRLGSLDLTRISFPCCAAKRAQLRPSGMICRFALTPGRFDRNRHMRKVCKASGPNRQFQVLVLRGLSDPRNRSPYG